MPQILIEPDDVARIDKAAIQSGIDSFGLMRKAGLAVAAACLRHHPDAARFVVVAGPGNNGGDGYIAANGLVEAGATVAVFSLGGQPAARGDAHQAFAERGLPLASLADYRPATGDVVIDALFGAGLSRDLPEEAIAAIDRIEAAGVQVIAVDIPSGIDGHSGAVLGRAVRAHRTITFMAQKPGMVLMPGRSHCGIIEIVDIGVPARIIEAHKSLLAINEPGLFMPWWRGRDAASHKYSHGHLVVFSGPPSATGAARMAAMAGLRGGAGLVSIACRPDAADTLAHHLTAIMIRVLAGPADLDAIAHDPRIGAVVIGPAFGVSQQLADCVLDLKHKALVLDADAITTFAAMPDMLFAALDGADCHAVLTPHDGEFARLFPALARNTSLSKPERALAAAQASNAVVVLKGADSVIAAPDGRVAVNVVAPPWLATAGSGDVLAGLIGSGLACGMPAYEAALRGVWLHSMAGERAGEGLTAETLINHIDPSIRT